MAETEKAKTVRFNLKYEFTTNGVVHGPGMVELEDDLAEDLMRRDAEYDKIERERLMSKEIIVDISKVTGQVFSGAGTDISTL